MTLSLVVAILTCVLAGFVCNVGLWTKRFPTAPLLMFLASLAVGLGFGLSACASYLSFSLFDASPSRLIVADIGLLPLLGIAGLRGFRRRVPKDIGSGLGTAPPS